MANVGSSLALGITVKKHTAEVEAGDSLNEGMSWHVKSPHPPNTRHFTRAEMIC